MSQSSKLPAIPGAQPASSMGGGINSAHAIKGRTKSLIGGQAAANGTSSRLRGNASNLLQKRGMPDLDNQALDISI